MDLTDAERLRTPELLPEHGANFISQVLDALTANPALWSQTAFFIAYDEEDGQFDHALRPAVPSYDASGNVMGGSTLPLAGEYFATTPALYANYLESADTISGSVRPWGFGGRVPMFVISPWTPAAGSTRRCSRTRRWRCSWRSASASRYRA